VCILFINQNLKLVISRFKNQLFLLGSIVTLGKNKQRTIFFDRQQKGKGKKIFQIK
jgi:hypothetical protein